MWLEEAKALAALDKFAQPTGFKHSIENGRLAEELGSWLAEGRSDEARRRVTEAMEAGGVWIPLAAIPAGEREEVRRTVEQWNSAQPERCRPEPIAPGHPSPQAPSWRRRPEGRLGPTGPSGRLMDPSLPWK